MAQNGIEVDEWLEGISHQGLKGVLAGVRARDPAQTEFLEAVREVAGSLQPVFEERPELLAVFSQMCEPERQVMFRVSWLDDAGNLRVNRGMRVQFSSAIGPYKGGLRFHPSVTLSVIKFLGFEQCFKNALTTLPLGGGKGGSDFDPKEKSNNEIMKFCQSFMTELYRHIGHETDVPAGDIGVGGREIGYLYGQYKRLTGEYTGVLTGKGLVWGGSEFRPEATGYGAVFFAEEVLKDKDESLAGKRCIVSGSGNVGGFCAEKLLEEGAVVLAMSDSRGYVFKEAGLTKEDVAEVQRIKSQHDGKLEDLKSEGVQYFGDRRKPWELDTVVDMAFPCATQGELDVDGAKSLVAHGCKYIVEGANMPTTAKAVGYFQENGVLYCPGKAANAGGVAVSGLEMSQNRMGVQWTREEVCERLRGIMQSIFRASKAAADKFKVDLVDGANIVAFLKLADAVVAQGAV